MGACGQWGLVQNVEWDDSFDIIINKVRKLEFNILLQIDC